MFKVDDYGSVEACLKVMEAEGYTPVRRVEKPYFKESTNGVEVAGRTITFEGVLQKHEQ